MKLASQHPHQMIVSLQCRSNRVEESFLSNLVLQPATPPFVHSSCALGGLALGGLALGGLAVGGLALGGLALKGLAFGGLGGAVQGAALHRVQAWNGAPVIASSPGSCLGASPKDLRD